MDYFKLLWSIGMAKKSLEYQNPEENLEEIERTQEEWATMLFSGKKYQLDREKKIQRLQDLKRIQMLKRGIRGYE